MEDVDDQHHHHHDHEDDADVDDHADRPPLVSIDPETGRLVYHTTGRGERLLDYSHCGYGGGGVALPDVNVEVKVILEPSTSSPPDDDDDTVVVDDTQRIQAAIDSISGVHHGVRNRPDEEDSIAAVLLRAGRYHVAGQLRIVHGGVVLRGEGEDRTVLVATGKRRRTIIHVQGRGTGMRKQSYKITRDRVRLGETKIQVERQQHDDDGPFRVGDRVLVQRNTNMRWIRRIGMDQLHKKGANDWRPEGYIQHYERFVTRVLPDEGAIVVHAGVPCTIQNNFGGGDVLTVKRDKRITHVGVESMTVVSEYERGREDDDEDHAWQAIVLDAVGDGWVRNVTAVHFGYCCVAIGYKTIRVTVQDCKYLEPVSQIRGGRRYSFVLDGQFCLIQRCYSNGGRHDFVNGSQVRGPNAFLDCVAEHTHADCGPHHRWTVSCLYDSLRVRVLNVQNRGACGSGHGWAGANTVFWNCAAADRIKCDSPPAAKNFCIGCTAERVLGDGYFESRGQCVEPRSLYLAQLKDRLGMEGVKRIATEEQYAFLE